MNPNSIYLDNNASTQAAPEVIQCMAEVMGEHWGNPSSLHGFGERAAGCVERARGQVAALIGARFNDEIVFTSGGTESINAAIQAALSGSWPNAVVLTGSTEHAAVLEPLARLEQAGREVRRIGVDHLGQLKLEELLAAIDEWAPHCALVSLQWANNETGALLATDALLEIAGRCRSQGALFHLDAVQIPGKLPIDVEQLGVDLLSISAHKFHGPQGVGALYMRRGSLESVSALIAGGPQESQRRGGTQNVPGIAGMGQAAALAQAHAGSVSARAGVRALRDALESGLSEALPGLLVHAKGAGAERLDNTSSVFIPGLDAELLRSSLAAEGLAISSGAACSSSKQGPSPVLMAMGCEASVASGSLRFSLSRQTTSGEIALALELVSLVAEELKALHPVQPLDPQGR